MSQENVEIVRRMTDAYIAGDFETARYETEEFIDAGEKVVTVERQSAGAAAAESHWLSRRLSVMTIRDGKIVRIVWFGSRAEAVEVVGLSE